MTWADTKQMWKYVEKGINQKKGIQYDTKLEWSSLYQTYTSWDGVIWFLQIEIWTKNNFGKLVD